MAHWQWHIATATKTNIVIRDKFLHLHYFVLNNEAKFYAYRDLYRQFTCVGIFDVQMTVHRDQFL